MASPLSPLPIAWAMPDPAVQPASWFRFDAPPPDAAFDAGDAPLEAALGWPTRTIAALRLGLQRRLARSCGFEAGKLVPADAAAAYAQAAKVFKRGVAYRAEGAALLAHTTRSGRYDIRIAASDALPPDLVLPGELAVLDANLATAWPELAERCGPDALVLAVDEHAKSLATVARIMAAWDGKRPLAVYGGGILCDVAGFAASLRGAPVRFVPTTLLAMADACVGGKTGVNVTPFGKNLVGTFYFPSAVDVWPGFLATLPRRELLAGGTECLKHAFLAGNAVLAEELTALLRANDVHALAGLLPAIIRFKADIVAEDPAETGRRATLNFGHTLAHALEALSQKRTTGAETLLHGEAVAIGMVFAIVLSRRVSTLQRAEADHLLDTLRRAGVVPRAAVLAKHLGEPDLKNKNLFTELRALIANDKKIQARDQAATDWVLLAKGGKVLRNDQSGFTTPVFDQELVSAWSDFVRYYLEMQ